MDYFSNRQQAPIAQPSYSPDPERAQKRAQILQTRRMQRLENQVLSNLNQDEKANIQTYVRNEAHKYSAQDLPYSEALSELRQKCSVQLHSQRNQTSKEYESLPPIFKNTPAQLEAAPTYSVSSTALKRHYPIKPKQNVYNEWGAVLKHQDEIEEEAKQKEIQRKKDMQKAYGEQLRIQASQRFQGKRRSSIDGAAQDKKLVRDQLEANRQREELERQRRDNIRALQLERIQSQLEERRLQNQRDRHHSQLERMAEIETHRLMQKQDNEKTMSLKMLRQQEAHQLRQVLDRQSRFKKQQQLTERESNREFVEAESKKLEKQEEERRQFFDKLRGLRSKVEENEKMFEQYKGTSMNELSKQDQLKYLSELERKLALDKQHQFQMKKISQQRNFDIDMTRQLQVKEKQNLKHALSLEDQTYARQMERQAIDASREAKQREAAQKQKQESYFSELAQQVELNQRQKRLEGLMSDHEKKVNKSDMKAYKYQQNQLHSMVPGIHNPNSPLPGHMQIDRMLGLKNAASIENPQLRQSRPMLGAAGANVLAQVPSRSPQFANNTSLNSLAPIMPMRRSYDPNLITGDHSQQEQLQKVKQNMKSIEALMLRNNTSNRSYGYNNFTQAPYIGRQQDTNTMRGQEQLRSAGLPTTYRGNMSSPINPGNMSLRQSPTPVVRNFGDWRSSVASNVGHN